MKEVCTVDLIKRKFEETGSPTSIPLLKRGNFTAALTDEGIEVSNLGNKSFLSWEVFQQTVNLLIRENGYVTRGNVMRTRLGDTELPLNSIEGHIAHVIYGKKLGDTVFRRITPIACILIWSGICEAAPRQLRLNKM